MYGLYAGLPRAENAEDLEFELLWVLPNGGLSCVEKERV